MGPAVALCAALLLTLVRAGPPCVTYSDFAGLSSQINDECCDEDEEACSVGLPTRCDAGCAAVLLPAEAACTGNGGFLLHSSMADVRNAIARAASMCHNPDADPLAACSTVADFNTLSDQVTAACCNGEDSTDCVSGLPTGCRDQSCQAIVLSVHEACTVKAGFLQQPAFVVTKAAYDTLAATCGTITACNFVECGMNSMSCSTNGTTGLADCLCEDGFNGDQCQYTMCHGLDLNCGNHGSCAAHGIEVECACHNGYSGTNCENDPCHGVDCGNQGTCSVNHRRGVCQCTEGWSGSNCQYDPCHGCATEQHNIILTRPK